MLVDNLFIINAKIENNGNQSIKEDDYERPLSFVFPDSLTVIHSRVVDASPKNIDISIEQNKNIAQISKSLLNPGDKVVIEFVLVGLQKSLTVQDVSISAEARISDLKSISVIEAIQENSFAATLQRAITLMYDVGAPIATVAVLVIGIGALVGKVSWGMAVSVCIGIAIIFSAPTLVQIIAR